MFIFKTILDPRVLLKEVSYVSKFNLTQHFGSDLRLKNLRSYTSLLIANDTIEIVHPSFLSTFFYSTLKVNIYNIMCFSIFLSTIIQASLVQYTFGFLRNQQMQYIHLSHYVVPKIKPTMSISMDLEFSTKNSNQEFQKSSQESVFYSSSPFFSSASFFQEARLSAH